MIRFHPGAWLLAAVAALTSWTGTALAAPESALRPAAATAPFERGVLWRVDHPGVAPSYLYGTLHHDDERVLALPAPVRGAFDGSRKLALEMLNDEDSIRAFRASMVSREPLLPGLAGEDVYPRLDELLGEHGIPRDARRHLKPWAALLVLLQPRDSPGIILDNLLRMEAVERGMAVAQLETIEEQIAAFAGMPPATQRILLRHALARYWVIQDAVRPSIHAYLDRDLGALWRINSDVMEGGASVDRENAQFLEAVLFSRSERFAGRLAPLLREGGAFAAMGALHLFGDRGVPSLLKKQGFRVTRVY